MRSYAHLFASRFLRQPLTLAATATPDVVARDARTGELPMHDPPLVPRDEAAFLLNAAAEVEHALMVQYLFAAYSVRVVPGDPHERALKRLQGQLLQIAREEMGHLMTVQNLAHLIGAPLNFYREHSPFVSEIYPFRFKLEPLSLQSLAKYVMAESPHPLPNDLSEDDGMLFEGEIRMEAERGNDGRAVRHVGPIYSRLHMLFGEPSKGLVDTDFRTRRGDEHGTYADWGVDYRGAAMLPVVDDLIVRSFPHSTVRDLRMAAAEAIKDVGDQGEAFDVPFDSNESHFERFLDLYKAAKSLIAQGVQVSWPLPVNPNTSLADDLEAAPPPGAMTEEVVEAHRANGRITSTRARAWAQLFNLRYRLLLGYVQDFLRREELLFVADGDRKGDRTARGLLAIRAFDEMRRLGKIASKLVRMPKDEPPAGIHAGPPFELPYTLALPDRPEDRWRTHLDATRAALALVRDRLLPSGSPDADDPFLLDLVAADETSAALMAELAAGRPVPESASPSNFQKAALIFEEGVRGFSVGRPHGSFWADVTLEQFLGGTFPSREDINPGDASGSELVRRLEVRASDPADEDGMPRFRPAIPEPRRRFIREWIDAGCPDGEPLGQVGIRHERDPEGEPVSTTPPVDAKPPEGVPRGYAEDIRPLFRESDRKAMLFAFDLWDFDQVKANADAILARLEDGSMPCDGAWADERIALFRRWVEEGAAP